MIKVSTLKFNPQNPRVIKDVNFHKLKASIEQFPKMMALRPLVIDENNVLIGGNARLKAIKELGMKEVPDEWVRKAEDLSEEEKKRFVIQDNVSLGDWDMEVLANMYHDVPLSDWSNFTQVFNPNLHPATSSELVTSEQVNESKRKLASQFETEAQAIKVTCPNCGHKFSFHGK